MTVGSSYSSGIVGLAGRLTDHREPVTHSAEFRLAGAGLPLVTPARVYICGITPYDVTHLGHAATFVWADAAESVLRSIGVQTVSCRNVTDIDDVLNSAANADGPALRRLRGLPGIPVRAGHGGAEGRA